MMSGTNAGSPPTIHLPVRVRHQRGRGVGSYSGQPSLMIVARQFRIENSVKIDSGSYYAFLNEHSIPW